MSCGLCENFLRSPDKKSYSNQVSRAKVLRTDNNIVTHHSPLFPYERWGDPSLTALLTDPSFVHQSERHMATRRCDNSRGRKKKRPPHPPG
ncbi:hypothetical protein AOLI_G00257830 [Acnodon oligacanthus]